MFLLCPITTTNSQVCTTQSMKSSVGKVNEFDRIPRFVGAGRGFFMLTMGVKGEFSCYIQIVFELVLKLNISSLRVYA